MPDQNPFFQGAEVVPAMNWRNPGWSDWDQAIDGSDPWRYYPKEYRPGNLPSGMLPAQTKEPPQSLAPYSPIVGLPNITKGMPDFANGDLMSFIAQLLKQLQSMGVKLPGMPGQGGQGQGLGAILTPPQAPKAIPGQQIADQIMQRIGPLTKNFY